MRVINVEIKALCSDAGNVRKKLQLLHAEFRGKDHQLDTYFNSASGRLKLREGNIENNLIYYERPDIQGPKTSNCLLFKTEAATGLREILEKSIGVKVRIDKNREIYFIDNIKIHLDEVQELGSFVEIEAQGIEDEYTEEYLLSQCMDMIRELGIEEGDLVDVSYSDLLIQKS